MMLKFTTESNSDENYKYTCFLHNNYPAWDVQQDHGRWDRLKGVISICQFQNGRLEYNRRFFTLNESTIEKLGDLLEPYDINLMNIHHINADPDKDLSDVLPVVWDLCTDPMNYEVLTDEKEFHERLKYFKEE